MKKLSLISLLTITLAACGGVETDSKNYPIDADDARRAKRGKITGEDGLTLFGGGSKEDSHASGLGVNSFLWRATLDTIGFMPIQTADPFGGVITTDWYEDPNAPGERLKINAIIMDERLRADGIKIKIFRQSLSDSQWRDMEVAATTNREIEDKILTRARELRVQQTGR